MTASHERHSLHLRHSSRTAFPVAKTENISALELITPRAAFMTGFSTTVHNSNKNGAPAERALAGMRPPGRPYGCGLLLVDIYLFYNIIILE